MVVLTHFVAPTVGIKHEQPSTTLFVKDREIGIGTLYIAESQLYWKKNSTGEGISLAYPQIAIHAVSRDLGRFEHECLLIVLNDYDLDGELVLDEEEEEEEGSDDEDVVQVGTEMRFVPADKGALDAMYQAMTHCQNLHPDAEDFVLSSEDEEEEEEFLDAHEGGNAHVVDLQELNLQGDDLHGGDSGYVEDNIIFEPSNRVNGHHRVAPDDDDDRDSAMECDPGQFEDAED